MARTRMTAPAASSGTRRLRRIDDGLTSITGPAPEDAAAGFSRSLSLGDDMLPPGLPVRVGQ